MKYIVETTPTGYVETLEFGKKKYVKTWEKTSAGAKCKDKEFWKQLEEDGITSEEIFDEVYDRIDQSDTPFGVHIVGEKMSHLFMED